MQKIAWFFYFAKNCMQKISKTKIETGLKRKRFPITKC